MDGSMHAEPTKTIAYKMFFCCLLTKTIAYKMFFCGMLTNTIAYKMFVAVVC